jgi:hypothetical protein
MKAQYLTLLIMAIQVLATSSCDDYINVDKPRTELVTATVFSDDETAKSAVADIYYTLTSSGFANGGSFSVSLVTSFSSDEQVYYSTRSAAEYLQVNNNALRSDNFILARLWSGLYSVIYKANAVIEGLTTSGVSPGLKNRLTGEAKFIRAFCHFYLVNLWGDVPLILSTDYKANNVIGRTVSNEVYDQIIQDLKGAQELLPGDYTDSNNERVRATSWAATAFLSRVYLYRAEWQLAETEADKIISNSSMFFLEPDLDKVFRKTSPEAILQLWSDNYPQDRNSFSVSASGPSLGALRTDYVMSFEPGDQRWAVWGRTRVLNNVSHLYTLKYRDFSYPPLDYTTILRLAEQYLIRAEARIQQDKLAEAAADINEIRKRAGLAKTSSATKTELMNDVMNERKAELFTEWGHRWFDLKRWGLAEQILLPLKPEWNNSDVLFPIPEPQIISNPSITQNPD